MATVFSLRTEYYGAFACVLCVRNEDITHDGVHYSATAGDRDPGELELVLVRRARESFIFELFASRPSDVLDAVPYHRRAARRNFSSDFFPGRPVTSSLFHVTSFFFSFASRYLVAATTSFSLPLSNASDEDVAVSQ